MKRDSRLSVALHVLLHMGEIDEPVTSESIGAMMRTNPVVVRRTMSGLREAGIVHSVKGHGGGFSLARALDKVSLLEVYEALGAPTLFSIGHREESPGCLVEKAVNRIVGKSLGDAERRLLEELGRTTVADIAADVRRKSSHCNSKGSQRHA